MRNQGSLTARWLLASLTCVITSAGLTAADEFISVDRSDHIMVHYRRLPVGVALAGVTIPASQEAAAVDLLSKSMRGRQVTINWEEDFGTLPNGTAKVVLFVGSRSVNEKLLRSGFAKLDESFPKTANQHRLFRYAERDAKDKSAGLWGEPEPSTPAPTTSALASKPAATSTPDDTATATVAAQSTTTTKESQPAKRATLQSFFEGDYVSEIGGKYYYHRDAAAVRRLDRAKLIYYQDEKAAIKAGKKAAPELKATTGDLASAEEAFQKGSEYYQQASGAPASKERDELYKKAFVTLTESMRDYRSYLEKNEDDAEAAKALRQVMQMRYGAMKYRRS